MSHEGLRRLPPNPYKALGVLPDAQLPEIRSAYRKLVFKNHPDKYMSPELKEQKRREFNRIQAAYEILSNDSERKRYDSRMKLAAARGEIEQSNSIRHDADLETGQKFHNGGNPAGGKGVSSGILVTRGRIDGTRTYAIPDTGAECNIITISFASALELRVRRHREGEQVRLRTANGRYIVTRGTTEANWQFASERSRTFKITFHVLEEFMYDLVFGNSFLMETETMSYHKDRLSRIPRPTNALSVLRVNLLGQTSQRVRGNIRTSDVLALPDSGSEPNLLSWKFVTERGLESLIDWDDERLLQFADGSLAKTEGSIRTKWRFASSSPSDLFGIDVKFHVSRDCIYDVILGQDVLEETDAFLTYEEDFIHVESDPECAGMNLVIFAPKKAKKSASSPRADDAIYSELQRRARADNEGRWAQNNSARGREEARREAIHRTPYSSPVHRESWSSDRSSISSFSTTRISRRTSQAGNDASTLDSDRSSRPTTNQQRSPMDMRPVIGGVPKHTPNRNLPIQMESVEMLNIPTRSDTSSPDSTAQKYPARLLRPGEALAEAEIRSEFLFNSNARQIPNELPRAVAHATPMKSTPHVQAYGQVVRA
ncbi:hypothetical protein F4811DRAFT_344510 [Daldinia bambusicola]|nr:hypothetical protein F4811DRAFT_344510 [Daldinia bambusicola]